MKSTYLKNIPRIIVLSLFAISALLGCEEEEGQGTQVSRASFVGSSSNIIENDESGTIVTVELDNPASGDGMVVVSLSDNLTYGTDYLVEPDTTAGNILLLFSAGERSKSFTVIPVNNQVKNVSKLLSLQLANSEGSIDLGAQKTYEVSILNEDEVMDVVLSTESNSLLENKDTLDVKLTAAAALTTLGNMVLTIESDNAVYGEDYVTLPALENNQATIVFSIGDTLQLLKLISIDNADIEENKTINLSIASYDGGVQAADQSLALTIVNDDQLAPPTITPSVGSLSFDDVVIGETSSVQNYSLSVTGLVDEVTVASDNANVLLSLEEAGTFTTDLTIPQATFNSGDVSIYAKYESGSIGTIEASISHNTLFLPEENVIDVTAETIFKPGVLESFEFGAIQDAFDNLFSSSDWVRVGGAVASIINYSPNSLSFPDYPGSGDGGALNMVGSNGFVNFTLPVDPLYGVGTYYVAAMMQVDELINMDKFGLTVGRFKLNGSTQFGCRLFTSDDGSGKAKIGIAKKIGDPVYSADSYNLDQTYVVVIKIQKIDGIESNDTDIVSLAVFDSALPTEEPASYDVAVSIGGDVNIDGLIFKQTANDNSISFDGIQTSRDWGGLLE